MDIIRAIEQQQIKQDLPDFNVGDNVKVHYRIVEGSRNAKLEISFFGPFYFGDYWVLDHAEDYSWSIVGEPSGRFLWLLTRTPNPSPDVRNRILTRKRELGYDTDRLHMTRHG